MNKYHSWTVPEMEQEAIRSDNTLALAIFERIKELEDTLKAMNTESLEELKMDVEYIKYVLDLENNF